MVRKLREKYGYSQKELAEKIGVSRPAIYMIEKGKNKLTVDNAKKLAEVFNVDWTVFFMN